ncbi:pentatricopeptide repeat-containing protein, chloroplastic-like protein [Cinnamomum micranthum f. kanehirae]|uniref:Pentatricopeptide repeat-containing protein, chloroplastic-like protein n=1 Tax=Cinnamomum micranthum f. kanehirae TaxID=337451 RepID=A0A3S3R302_9MAGN|nr:pentatricopeptide repeat-containing protein, chloroplastic-like protein [Cinnamomum micranthum f. kanehirae]
MHHIQLKQFSLASIQHHKQTIIHLLQSPSTTTKQLKQIHAQLLQSPSSFSSFFLCNSLLFAYAASSTPTHAFSFFATQMGHLHPNNFTFQFLLKASSKSKSVFQTVQIHSMTLKLGFGSYTFLQNAVLHCYVVCGCVVDARQVFDEMPHKDVVSFNSMIHGYCNSGEMDAASRLFSQTPDPNVISWTAMVVGYSSIGDVAAARQLFDRMPDRDLVSWNAMISSYVQNRHPIEALNLFCQMQAENFTPNPVTVSSVLSACANVGALDTGKWIHVFLNKKHFRLDPFLGTALIDMYAKCGVVELALEVFGRLQERNSCTWNAMINGLATNGHAKQALDLFSKMQVDRSVRPDEVTFVGVLLACSHGGFLEEGKKHFYCTLRDYGVNPLVEHYACMVDLLGRYGLLKEAEHVIRNMTIVPDVVVWRALLGGCRLHKDVELAERVVSEMEARDSGDYVLLSNLYASIGRWDDVEKVRKIMKDQGIQKIPGCSSIVIENTIHEFISGDKSHPRYAEINEKLEELGRKMAAVGYLAETGVVFYDIDEEEKEQALGHHSEKLAIGFGLISTAAATTIRIVKNLRVCNDCHTVTKLISKIYNREIVVRDRVRFHHFKDGECSCKDYW